MSIFRLYNQNRILFWTIIIAIVVFVFIIHTINSIVANNNNNKIQNTIIDEKLYENKISIEEQISDEQVEQKEELIIDQFIRYCNAKNTQSAYDLLTEECKEEVFPTIESFENNYLKFLVFLRIQHKEEFLLKVALFFRFLFLNLWYLDFRPLV